MPHPILVLGFAVLAGYLLDEYRATLRAQAEEETRRRQALEGRRRRAVSRVKEDARRAALAATRRMIKVLKEELRAAARARDQLPWRSHQRDQAHELVAMLTKRLNALYAKKKKLYTL